MTFECKKLYADLIKPGNFIDKSVDGKNAICSPINTKFLSVVSAASTPSQSAWTPQVAEWSKRNPSDGTGFDLLWNRFVWKKQIGGTD